MPALSVGAVKCTCCNHIEGVREERAKVVAWLRRDSFRLNNAREAADAIERGEHWPVHRVSEGDQRT